MVGWMDRWLRKRTARQYKSGFSRLPPATVVTVVRIIRSMCPFFYLRLGSVGVRMNFAIRFVTSAIEMNHRDLQHRGWPTLCALSAFESDFPGCSLSDGRPMPLYI